MSIKNFLSIEKFFCRSRNFLSIEKLPVNREFFHQSTNWKACSDIRQKKVISGATSRNGRCFFERINRVSNLPAQVSTISILRGWSPKPCGAFPIFLLVALQSFGPVRLSKFYRYALRLETIAGDQFRKTEKSHTVFLDWYRRSLRTKLEVNL